MKIIIPLILVITINLFPQITDITRLPVQDSSRIYLESAPVVISENEILVFFLTRQTDYNSSIADTLFCSRSTDRGETWQTKQFIIEVKTSYISSASQLTAIRTETGRIIIAFTDLEKKKIGIIHSDDNYIE